MSRRPLAHMLSASTADVSAVPRTGARMPPPAAAVAGPRLRPRDFYLGLLVAAIAVGALSLLIPSTPSYDPWAWIVWGREIVHLRLHTIGGPSWKPLPMIFTVPFALFGKAAPDLWLVVARAGAFAAVVMVFRLSYRFTRRVGGLLSDVAEGSGRLVAVGPGVLAGLIAAVGLTLWGHYISDNALGYSEGLATALMLVAGERAYDGHPRQAFAVGFFVALDRPETWLFWGPYGLWLFWRDPGARPLVAALAVLTLACWFLPEYWGSGHFLRGVSRAQHPRSNSLAFASSPFKAELVDAAWPQILLRIKVVAALLVVAVAGLEWRDWRRGGVAALRTPRARARIAAAICGLAGLAWFVLIAIMTQIGFSGNNRYLVIGSALVEICGAVGWGWAALEVGGLAVRAVRRGRSAVTGTLGAAALWAAAALGAAAFLVAPNWLPPTLVSLPRTHGALVYQAHLRQGLNRLVARYGGARRMLSCGQVMTEGFQVPMVAWRLGVHTIDIEGPPASGAPPGPAPNVVLQTRDTRGAALLPILHAWPQVRYQYVGTSGPVRLFTHCGRA